MAEIEKNDLLLEMEIFLNNENFKSNKKIELILGTVGEALVKNAEENELDIKGFSHSFDNFFVLHVLNKHGNKPAEENRGNIAITLDDIKKIPQVLQEPDYLIYGTKTKTGNKAIVFAKNMEGATIFVEEIRKGKMKLAAQTLYKLPKTIDVSFIKNAPNLYAHSDLGTIKIVDVKKEIVKKLFLTREENDLHSKEINPIVEEHFLIKSNNHNPLTDDTILSVDGRKVRCRQGLIKGIETATRKIKRLSEENKQLRNENERLIQKQNRTSSMRRESNDMGMQF